MPHPVVRLCNGLRLIHKEIDSPISNFGVLVNAGTRDELESQTGLAHFVEHTIFKGTKKRTAYRIFSRMEDVGGTLNASTAKEETYFYSTFLSPDYPRAVELLADIFFNATFPEKELEKEKTVVLEEIDYYEDTPSELIYDEFENFLFDGHPLGRNILGTKKSVKTMTRAAILDFMAQNYTLDHIVLASVGNISTKRLVQLCNRFFGCTQIPKIPRQRLPFLQYVPQEKRVKKKSNQTNGMVGGLAYDIMEDKRIPFLLLTNVLGGQGMNTRLNMSIREKHGLAYDVEANYTPFSDTGFFSIYFGCDNHHTDSCLELIYKELEKTKRQKMGTLQLYYAKKQFIGQLALANEVKLNEMLALGHEALFFEDVDTLEESLEDIRRISAEEIIDVANEIFDFNRFCILIHTSRNGVG